MVQSHPLVGAQRCAIGFDLFQLLHHLEQLGAVALVDVVEMIDLKPIAECRTVRLARWLVRLGFPHSLATGDQKCFTNRLPFLPIRALLAPLPSRSTTLYDLIVRCFGRGRPTLTLALDGDGVASHRSADFRVNGGNGGLTLGPLGYFAFRLASHRRASPSS